MDNSLPCKGCGKPRPQRVIERQLYYCNDQCKKLGKAKGPGLSLHCRICGVDIRDENGLPSRAFCSSVCLEQWHYPTGQPKTEYRKQSEERRRRKREIARRNKELRAAVRQLEKSQKYEGVCARCGKHFRCGDARQKYCSKSCGNMQRKKDYRHRRRQSVKQLPGLIRRKAIGIAELAMHDNYKCGICGDPVDMNLRKSNSCYEPYSPVIDHIVPLSKGGKHEWDNVQIAHHICNTLKKDSMPTKRKRRKAKQLGLLDDGPS